MEQSQTGSRHKDIRPPFVLISCFWGRLHICISFGILLFSSLASKHLDDNPFCLVDVGMAISFNLSEMHLWVVLDSLLLSRMLKNKSPGNSKYCWLRNEYRPNQRKRKFKSGHHLWIHMLHNFKNWSTGHPTWIQQKYNLFLYLPVFKIVV